MTGYVPLYLQQFMYHVATFYSFIDFAFMADGTKVVTVWDASVYPAHALYVDGIREEKTQFREGMEWVETGWFWEHKAFRNFGLDAQKASATPFDQAGHFLYRDNFGTIDGFRTGAGDHPVMNAIKRGSTLDGNENEFQDPMFPNFSTY